jgi:hypothetical protein
MTFDSSIGGRVHCTSPPYLSWSTASGVPSAPDNLLSSITRADWLSATKRLAVVLQIHSSITTTEVRFAVQCRVALKSEDHFAKASKTWRDT